MDHENQINNEIIDLTDSQLKSLNEDNQNKDNLYIHEYVKIDDIEMLSDWKSDFN